MSSISPTDGGYSYYQKNLSDLEDDMTSENKRLRKNTEEREKELEESYRNDIRKHDEASERAVEGIRERNRERLAAGKDSSRVELERAKQETYDKYGRANKDLDFERRKALAAIEESKTAYELARKRDEEAMSNRDAAVQDVSSRKLNEAIGAERQSRVRENSELRDRIGELIEDDRTKMNARARADSLNRDQLERELSLREKALQTSHQDELNKAKYDADTAEARYAAKNSENIRERDAYYAGVVRNQSEANNNQTHENEAAYERALGEQRLIMKKQNDNNEFQLQRLHEKEDLARTQALENQAAINRNDLARQKTDYESQVDRLNNEIHDRDRRGADGKGPATLEQRIYNNLTEKYEKTSREQVARDTRRTDHLANNYRERLQKLNQDHQNQLTETQRQFAAERSADNRAFVDQSFEMEQASKLALDTKDQESSRQNEEIRRTYGNMIDRQRRDYENILQQSRDDASTRLKSLRQDSDFSSKMAQRNFTLQQNEMIRAYEKKMAEQKNHYEDQIDTLKNQITVATHEGERRMQRALDDQQRGYEQKIAQMEYQNKERERILTQNYEDQIDKIKRANALLIQKKS
jgi:hypothetical protein